MSFEKRQPWNAFPLAALSIRKLHPEISACAADILRYLSTRSNWRGETVVGQRRIKDDTGRSKDYVTRGMNELVNLKLVTTIGRKRAASQADRHIISVSILSKEYRDIILKDRPRNDPEEQEDGAANDPDSQDDSNSNNPDFHSNDPDHQDFRNPDFGSNNPDRQDETLQNEPYRKDNNLTGLEPKDQKQVSQSVSKLVTEPEAPLVSVETRMKDLMSKYDNEVLGMVDKLHPVFDWEMYEKELPFADNVRGYCPEEMDALDVLAYNQSHKPSSMVIRSWEYFWVKVLKEGTSNYLLDDYATHDSEHCKTCKERGLVSLAKKQEARQREAVHRALEEAEARRLEAEAKRLEALARFEFREVTNEEVESFRTLLGDGWTHGCIKKMKDEQSWQDRHIIPASLWFLKLGQPVSWADFSTLVEQIRELDKPIVSAP